MPELILQETFIQILKDNLELEYRDLRNAYRAEKKKYSEASKAFDKDIYKVGRKRKLHAKDKIVIYRTAGLKYDAYASSLQGLQDVLRTCLRALIRDFHSGALALNPASFDAEVQDLEKKLSIVIRHLLIARASEHTIQAFMIDEAMNGNPPTILPLDDDINSAEYDSSAYADLFINGSRILPNATRSSSNRTRDRASQNRFRASVMKAYGALRQNSRKREGNLWSRGEFAWCAVSGQYWPSDLVIPVHIVDYNLGESTAECLFGPADKSGDGHLMSAQNGLPMLRVYEREFVRGDISFKRSNKVASGYQVIVLGAHLRKYRYGVTMPVEGALAPWGMDLHGRQLSFLNSFRPAEKYMHFSFLLNILRRQRHQVPGWWEDQFQIDDGWVWKTPSTFKVSTLRYVAKLVGNLDEEDADEMAERLSIDSMDDDLSVRDAARVGLGVLALKGRLANEGIIDPVLVRDA